jgi:poly-gamma-glutamate synthesis protein (capsule biosynthesis protein)
MLDVVPVRAALALMLSCVACAQPPPAPLWTPVVPRPFAIGKTRVTVLFAGDINLGRHINQGWASVGKRRPTWLFEQIKPVLDEADLVFANLECVLADTADGRVDKTAIRAPTANGRALVAAGVDVVSLANNHAMDFGHVGFFSTLRTTAELGLLVTGVDEEGDGQELLLVEVGAMKMGFLAYNPHGDEWDHPSWYPRSTLYDLDDVIDDIERARPLVDQLVVSLHWGPELSHAPWPWQRDHAHEIVDAGADFVIGHHAHVQQEVEQYRGKLIAYSLGDLAFDKRTPWIRSRTRPRFLIAADFDGATFLGHRLIPITHDEQFRPLPAPGQDIESLLARPDTSRWRASRAIEDAEVVRDGRACDDFTTARRRLPGGFLRWLSRRWLCPTDAARPGDAVAASAELSDFVLRHGVWASPGDASVVVRFEDVPLGDALDVVVGWPDWVVDNELEHSVGPLFEPELSPVLFEVRVDDRLLLVETVLLEKGWHELSLATAALGGEHDVTVEVRGARRATPGFLFELAVPGP